MDRRARNNALTVAGFAGGVVALGALITVMLAFGRPLSKRKRPWLCMDAQCPARRGKEGRLLPLSYIIVSSLRQFG